MTTVCSRSSVERIELSRPAVRPIGVPSLVIVAARYTRRELKMGGPDRFHGFADLLAAHAEAFGSRSALIFLENGEGQAAELTYPALHRHASAIAAGLVSRGLQGERVLLLFPSGLEYP